MTSKKYPIKKQQGVFGYDSATKRVNGKPDVCLYITFKVDGKKTTEKVGWASEGYTPQLNAVDLSRAASPFPVTPLGNPGE